MFGAVFERGRRPAIAAAERIGGRILEVGVGTGISLPEYACSNRIIGVDLSRADAAQGQGAGRRAPAHQRRGARGDGRAASSAFNDGVFDVVVAQYVITAVPEPEATLDEFARVLRPGGEIMLVNHLGAESGLRATFERGFAPLARRLGWRPEFGWARLVAWAARRDGVRIIERRPMPPLGHFSLIRFGRVSEVAAR